MRKSKQSPYRLFKGEVIDGSPSLQNLVSHKRLISESFSSGVESLGWLMHHTDRDEDKPQDFRIASWVERSRHKLGYALGMSRTKVIPDTLDEFTVVASFFSVDRDNRRVVNDYPKAMLFNSTQTTEEAGERALEIFDKDELVYGVEMLDKMAKCFERSDFDNSIDEFVGRAIINSHLDHLADNFPERNLKPVEPPKVA